MSCESSEPERDGGDDEFGAPVGEAFGVAGGEVAELFEAGEAALDDVAVTVDLGVEVRWATASSTLGLTACDLVDPLRCGERDPALPQRSAGRGMRVRLVRDHPIGTLTGSTRPHTTHADLIEQREQLRVVASLTGCDHDRHRQPAAVNSEMDLAGQPASRASKTLTIDRERFDPPASGPPVLRAPAAC